MVKVVCTYEVVNLNGGESWGYIWRQQWLILAANRGLLIGCNFKTNMRKSSGKRINPKQTTKRNTSEAWNRNASDVTWRQICPNLCPTCLVSLEPSWFLKFPRFLWEPVAARHNVSPQCCSGYICVLCSTVEKALKHHRLARYSAFFLESLRPRSSFFHRYNRSQFVLSNYLTISPERKFCGFSSWYWSPSRTMCGAASQI